MSINFDSDSAIIDATQRTETKTGIMLVMPAEVMPMGVSIAMEVKKLDLQSANMWTNGVRAEYAKQEEQRTTQSRQAAALAASRRERDTDAEERLGGSRPTTQAIQSNEETLEDYLCRRCKELAADIKLLDNARAQVQDDLDRTHTEYAKIIKMMEVADVTSCEQEDDNDVGEQGSGDLQGTRPCSGEHMDTDVPEQ